MRAAVIFALSLSTAAALSNAATSAPKSRLRSLFSRGADAVIADPKTKTPLASETIVLGGMVRSRYVSESGAAYPVTKPYVDLLPTSGRSAPLSIEELQTELLDAWSSRTQTQLFRSPLTSFLYERGWREGFKNAGFPGIEKEFEEVQRFFEPVASNGVVVDRSCGSGLMTRRLLKSGAYGRVLALDYSESMLLETARRVREEAIPDASLMLCRADVSSLPLAPASIDAMHAGAAMHCWPKLEQGLAQIRASLKPGGRFFATTFFQGAYGRGMPQQNGGAGFRFFDDEAELTKLLIDAGFPPEGVTVRREGRGCAIIRCEVPMGNVAPATEAPMQPVAEVDDAAPPVPLEEPTAEEVEAEWEASMEALEASVEALKASVEALEETPEEAAVGEAEAMTEAEADAAMKVAEEMAKEDVAEALDDALQNLE